MNKTPMRKSLLVFVVAFLVLQSPASLLAQQKKEIIISDFGQSGIEQWQQERFVGETRYKVVEKDGAPALLANTNASASALYRNMEIKVTETPFLNWSWLVENVYNLDNPHTKAGDDYPARIYIVVKTGFFPWQTRALNYVWCNKKPSAQYWPNPFTEKAVMIPVRCGEEGLGSWHHERVNFVADYKRIFNKDLKKIHGIAIMTDSDNGKGKARAYYKKIVLSN